MTAFASRRAAEARQTGGYFHPQFRAHTMKVFLGHHLVSDRSDVMMVTTLGSCVAACVHDPATAIGGMNHFLLPEVPESEDAGTGAAARYGSVAMERLINDLLARGAQRGRLEVKLFGGARVIDSSFDVGQRNAAFALDYVRREGLKLMGQDLGGASARRIHYFPHTGRAMRKMLRPEALSETANQELHFRSSLRHQPIEGDVELFGED
ncbi:chemotaxis protein CheD [Azospirillum brasilense]|uniref:Probable chemoreceptor glutamine deamidase CheD n=1 Tax=Azospirillum brasilense TaxID=192 RepID=A0A560B3A8_AZOBR|nr:chemotaxis protein [Azospirillum brasilense]MBK3735891.1 chemotaxis protein [Azospirillum brasilense]TWA67128.1 chemotaxis protein CheD [Azospirillum brasilense]TWA85028.1 chemotaxis protein CheD [Azospirillum brasilense]